MKRAGNAAMASLLGDERIGHEGRVALMLRMLRSQEEFVVGPIVANYPNCSITTIEQEEPVSAGYETWTAELQLTPELFPILRHAQFEDMLNRNFADPLSGILRAIKADEHLRCRIEIAVTPATHRRCHQAVNCVKRLDRIFFRHHHRLARYYASHITKPRRWLFAWILGLIARRSEEPTRPSLETSTSRAHEREDDLQAASEKIGGHLFETHLRLETASSASSGRLATGLRWTSGKLQSARRVVNQFSKDGAP